MANQVWHDINEPGTFTRVEPEQAAAPAPVEEAVAPKEEPSIRLVKGEWSPGPDGFQLNKNCTAKITAQFLGQTVRRRISVDTFVIFKDQEETLGGSVEGLLSDDGGADVDLTLFVGQAYHAATAENPDDNLCHYIFRVSGQACSNTIESARLEMPFLEPCVKKRQEATAQSNAAGSNNGCASGKNCTSCEDREACAQSCEFLETCEMRDKCDKAGKPEEPEGPQEQQQAAQAESNKAAAAAGSPCTHDCGTCGNKEACGES